MAITIIWDQVSGSEVMLAVREAGYYVRCGAVRGMTDAVTTPTKALTDAVMDSADAPPYDHPDARLTTFKLRYVIVRADSPTTGMIWAHYAPLTYSGSPIERLAIEAGGAIEYEQSERLWETGEPFLVRLPSDPPETGSVVDSTLDTADADVSLQTLALPRVTKIISLYGLFAEVPGNLEDLDNCVNSVDWPPASPGVARLGLSPRRKGHWLASPTRVRWSQRDGLYAVAVTLASKGKLTGEDWSSYKFAVDPTTGKFLAPSAALMTVLADQAYEYGIRNNTGGVLKVGQFHLANFAAILNPLIQNSPLEPASPLGSLEGR
jgi:hypothetical protein